MKLKAPGTPPQIPDQAMSAWRPVIAGTRHMVAAGHYLAAQAGLQILEDGGNAVDAGVAAAMVCAVVQSDQVNCAGVAPMLIRLAADGRVVCIDGLGVWPRQATCTLFRERHGGRIPEGVARTVVPAAPSAWLTALGRFGTMRFGEVAAAAIRSARDGFVMYEPMASRLRQFAGSYRRWPSSAAIYLPGGHVPEVGERFVQADLARSLQYLADAEARHSDRQAGLDAAHDAFYRGEIAAAITRFHAAEGGLMTAADLADFRVRIEDAVTARFRGIDIHACGPWSQGPALLQALRILDGCDLAGMGHNTPAYLHTLVETIKLVFADRDAYYGDPSFVEVPLDMLLSDGFAAERRAAIDPARAFPRAAPAGGPDRPPPILAPAPGNAVPSSMLDTSYVAVVDGAGNAFSCSPSDQAIDTPVVPGTGLCPSSRGSQSWTVPGHPAAIAPGKRPRLTPNPAIAVRDRAFVMPFGSPGGDVQVQAMLQALLNLTVFDMDPQMAVEAPRVVSYGFPDSFEPHACLPARINLEGGIPGVVGDALAALGHDVRWWPERAYPAGGVCLVHARQQDGVCFAAADPRRASYAAGR